jgi:type 2 lantibiotic biosynthesis protein LanM
LLDIVARAAPPGARVEAASFASRPRQDEARIARQREVWCRALNAREAHGADVARDPDEAFERGLLDVDVADEGALPDWARSLIELVALAAGSDPSDRSLPADGQLAPLTPFLRAADGVLLEHAEALGVDLTPSGRDEIVGLFGQRLWRLTDQVLAFDSRMARSTAGFLQGLGLTSEADPTDVLDGWLDRLERLPALAYLLGVTFHNWRRHVAEILGRLVHDRNLLERRLFEGEPMGALSGFQGDAGDVHNGGRAVGILSFTSGHKVVYKPKDLRVAGAFHGLVAELNSMGLDPPLPVPVVLPRDGYAWEEFVERGPCPDEAAVGRFYRRMGMWTRLIQFLEGRDFWLDNLVARGEEPIFVDLETLVQPRRPAVELSPAEQIARDRLEESPILTCTVTMPTPIAPGVRAEDLGALAPARRYLSPFPRPGSPAATNDDAPPGERFMTWSHPEHAPTLRGRPVEAGDHLEAILEGYSAMQQCLLASRHTLSAAESPLAAFRDVPVRFIFRDTWSCLRIARASAAPALLADPIDREIFLVKLHGAVANAGLDPELADRHRTLIDREIRGLRDLDVPLFVSRPDWDGVRCPDGTAVSGFFEGTAWERLRRRVATLDTFPLAEQLDLIRSSFAWGHPPPSPPSVAPVPRTRRSPDWLAEASAIAESLLVEASSATGAPDDLAWIGLAYHPQLDLETVEVLRPDLLSGTCGPAVLFADLARVTGQSSWADVALGALSGTLRATLEAGAAWADLSRPGSAPRSVAPSCGAFYGIGAHVYTLRRCATVLARPDLAAQSDRYLRQLPLDTIAAAAPPDVVSGVAGQVLALAAPSGNPDLETVGLAAHLLRLLEGRRGADGRLPRARYPGGGARLAGLPGTAAGVALAHARTASAGLASGGAALPHAEPPAPGDLLAMLELSHDQDAPRGLASMERTVRQCLARSADSVDTVVALDGLEVALTAWELTREEWLFDRARDIAGRILQRRSATGSWFPGTIAADRHRLSLVYGVPAIAHAFLRLRSLAPDWTGQPVASVRRVA